MTEGKKVVRAADDGTGTTSKDKTLATTNKGENGRAAQHENTTDTKASSEHEHQSFIISPGRPTQPVVVLIDDEEVDGLVDGDAVDTSQEASTIQESKAIEK